jgi:hypothetical protein
MSDPAAQKRPDVIRDDEELIERFTRIDQHEKTRNIELDSFAATKAKHEQMIAQIDANIAIEMPAVVNYWIANEKRLKRKLKRNKLDKGGTIITSLIVGRSLVTTKPQDKVLKSEIEDRQRLEHFLRTVVSRELDRERISASRDRQLRALVKRVGGYIGRKQKTTIQTPSMRTPLVIEERHTPRDPD